MPAIWGDGYRANFDAVPFHPDQGAALAQSLKAIEFAE